MPRGSPGLSPLRSSQCPVEALACPNSGPPNALSTFESPQMNQAVLVFILPTPVRRDLSTGLHPANSSDGDETSVLVFILATPVRRDLSTGLHPAGSSDKDKTSVLVFILPPPVIDETSVLVFILPAPVIETRPQHWSSSCRLQ